MTGGLRNDGDTVNSSTEIKIARKVVGQQTRALVYKHREMMDNL